MADEAADKPLANLAAAETKIDAPAPESEIVPVSEPMFNHLRDAKDRLRAFEDEHVGEDAVRINGQIERGIGSPFQKLSAEHKRQYVALERLIAAEQKIADAHAALAAAEAEYEAAQADTEPKSDGTSGE